MFQDTICAISTAPGVGGIAVIRVSGKKATEICNACVSVDVMAMKANTCRFARFVRPNGEVLDEVMLTLFKAPHSFTGEDTIEIACHGSQYIQQCILQDLVAGGARLARAGEFTQRAFLNGKMDLSQAEAVADLIASTSRAAHRIALKQMRGGFSDELSRLRSKLLDFTSLVELELDFADHEELEFADRSQLQALAIEIESKISRLTQSFSLGNAIKNGIPVAIVGKTNAGKSTLLNALVGEEKAIVSDIHGTTRDVIEDCISIDGIQFRFFDTAGLRETDDEIESLGIARSYRSIDKAQIVLWLIDSAELLAEKANAINFDESEIAVPEDKTCIVVFNKIDKVQAAGLDISSLSSRHPHCHISAKQGLGLDRLRQMLIEASQIDENAL
ncbi:MAG: tRNA uridine-5-carboxymethylaminomethyl(34) synthesis GTPase MnmE, partial [Bacteroidales bacterium]|nr:tRNA uridine-5-carboxymethylaminomethyl(34) synthesis GTPase MnmE [Bacteroidales bacterium]